MGSPQRVCSHAASHDCLPPVGPDHQRVHEALGAEHRKSRKQGALGGELRQFDERGLKGNTFWQRSFRSIVIRSEQMFWQKLRYIQLTPVRSGLAERPEEYLWSSAAHSEKFGLDLEAGLPYTVLMEECTATGAE